MESKVNCRSGKTRYGRAPNRSAAERRTSPRFGGRRAKTDMRAPATFSSTSSNGAPGPIRLSRAPAGRGLDGQRSVRLDCWFIAPSDRRDLQLWRSVVRLSWHRPVCPSESTTIGARRACRRITPLSSAETSGVIHAPDRGGPTLSHNPEAGRPTGSLDNVYRAARPRSNDGFRRHA